MICKTFPMIISYIWLQHKLCNIKLSLYNMQLCPTFSWNFSLTSIDVTYISSMISAGNTMKLLDIYFKQWMVTRSIVIRMKTVSNQSGPGYKVIWIMNLHVYFLALWCWTPAPGSSYGVLLKHEPEHVMENGKIDKWLTR